MQRRLILWFLCAACGHLPAEPLWTESFETAFPPAGWRANSVETNTTYAFSGAVSARLNATNDWLITPLLSSAVTFVFQSRTTAADPGVVVELSDQSDGPWSEAVGSPFYGQTDRWNERSVPLPGPVFVRFRKTGTGTLYLDDVTPDDGTAPRHRPPLLAPVGNRTVPEFGTLEFTVSASDPIDGDPFTLSAAPLPPGATFESGVFRWSPATPAGEYAVTVSATDIDGTSSETVALTVFVPPPLFFSEIADPAETGGDLLRFVELFYAGTEPLDLSAGGWHLAKQVNGGTWYETPLVGTVEPGTARVIANSAPDFEEFFGFAPDQENSLASGNGDDAYFLFCNGGHSTGFLIDAYGEEDTDGTGTAWDYEDDRAERDCTILRPRAIWCAEEWNFLRNAAPEVFSPGRHGPLPKINLPNTAFVFSGDDLNLAVTTEHATSLEAVELPVGARFTLSGTGAVSGALSWVRPTNGTYRATFAATSAAGTNVADLTITVASQARTAGWFHGWSGDTILKLANGQFWRQIRAGSKTVAPALWKPAVVITNHLAIERRLYFGTDWICVSALSVTESSVTNAFSGLHYDRLYQLADGTAWRQISFENLPAAADRPVAWRWLEAGTQRLRLIGSNGEVLGTCTVNAVQAPPDPALYSNLDGWFYGFGKGRFFHLTDGSWWRQISPDTSASTRRNPSVVLRSEAARTWLELPIEGLRAEVVPMSVLYEGILTNAFTGLHYGNLYQLNNGDRWLQISFENLRTNAATPAAVLWASGTQTRLLLRDAQDRTLGDCAVARPDEDADGDQMSNAKELAAGSDPADPASLFTVAASGSPVVLHWTPVEDRIYRIEWTAALTAPFQSVEDGLVFPQNSWTNSVQSVGGFYRITVRPVAP